jgi:hypothetical protein
LHLRELSIRLKFFGQLPEHRIWLASALALELRLHRRLVLLNLLADLRNLLIVCVGTATAAAGTFGGHPHLRHLQFHQMLLEQHILGILGQGLFDPKVDDLRIVEPAFVDQVFVPQCERLLFDFRLLFPQVGDVVDEQVRLRIALGGLRAVAAFGDFQEVFPLGPDLLLQFFQALGHQVACAQPPLLHLEQHFIFVGLGDGVDQLHKVLRVRIVGERDAENLALLRELNVKVVL